MDSGAVAGPLSSPGITGEGEDKLRLAERPPVGPIYVASSSPLAFSSDDEDEGSSSSLCSSTTSTFLSDDEEDQGEEGLTANSPLRNMSDLMIHLPIKRGLSRHYNGKSQSYTSLASVTSVHDLPKPERGPARKKLKSCRIYKRGMADHGGGGGCHNTINLCFPPPLPYSTAAAPLKLVPATNKIELGSSFSSLHRPMMMGADRSGGFLRSSWRSSPVPPREHNGRFPASHPQAMLFA